jgi:hypothetical protein
MKLLSELNEKEIKAIEKFLKDDYHLKVNVQKTRIEFSPRASLYTFTIHSTELEDDDYGLLYEVDLNKILDKFFQHKPKHTTSLRERISAVHDIEKAFSLLKWEINDVYTLRNIEGYAQEDPLDDNFYELLIRKKNHIIVDEKVYEGELNSFKSLFHRKPLDELSLELGKEFIVGLKELFKK